MRTTATKFWAALLIAVANSINSRYGIDFGIDDKLATDIVAYVIAGAVWVFANKPKPDKTKEPDWSAG